MGGDIQNIDFKCDSVEVKGRIQRGNRCTARLHSQNHVILQQNEGIQ